MCCYCRRKISSCVWGDVAYFFLTHADAAVLEVCHYCWCSNTLKPNPLKLIRIKTTQTRKHDPATKWNEKKIKHTPWLTKNKGNTQKKKGLTSHSTHWLLQINQNLASVIYELNTETLNSMIQTRTCRELKT